MSVKRKATSPPWWCRAALYAALWPSVDLIEYRLSMQREYLRALKGKAGSKRRARQYAKLAGLEWTKAAGYRIARSVMKIALIFKVAN